MTADQQHQIESLVGQLQPLCVGRYMVDVPEQFYAEGAAARINDERLKGESMPWPAFEQRIRLREEELRNTQVSKEINAPYLKGVHPLSGNAKGVIFEHNVNFQAQGGSRNLEAHYYHNGVAFVTKIYARDYSSDMYIEQRRKRPKFYINDLQERLAELRALIARVQGIQPGDPVPQGKGFCFDQGFIAGDSLSIVGSPRGKEEMGTRFEVQQFPRLVLKFDSNNYIKEDNSILDRANSMVFKLLGFNLRVLSKGKRLINGLEAEELLLYDSSDSESHEYSFNLYINEKHGSNSTPLFHAMLLYRLDGRKLGPDDMTEKQLKALWYQVTQSIRTRPGAI